MGSVNKVIVVGNIGRDAELRYTPSGAAVAVFSVATSERWKDKQTGDQREQTEWHRVSLWGWMAESVHEYLRKGRQVYVEGQIRTQKWKDRDGNERTSWEIRAQRVTLLGRPGDDAAGGRDSQAAGGYGGGASSRTQRHEGGEGGAPAGEEPDDFADVPF